MKNLTQNQLIAKVRKTQKTDVKGYNDEIKSLFWCAKQISNNVLFTNTRKEYFDNFGVTLDMDFFQTYIFPYFAQSNTKIVANCTLDYSNGTTIVSYTDGAKVNVTITKVLNATLSHFATELEYNALFIDAPLSTYELYLNDMDMLATFVA